VQETATGGWHRQGPACAREERHVVGAGSQGARAVCGLRACGLGKVCGLGTRGLRKARVGPDAEEGRAPRGVWARGVWRAAWPAELGFIPFSPV
jgi:hypothetical protein